MAYQYELLINGTVKRRKYGEFNTNIIKLMVEDAGKLNSKQNTFQLSVKRAEWDDRTESPEIEYVNEPK